MDEPGTLTNRIAIGAIKLTSLVLWKSYSAVDRHCFDLKRWAFSRCLVCDKGFEWGETIMELSTHGPCWFRDCEAVAHVRCYDAAIEDKEQRWVKISKTP